MTAGVYALLLPLVAAPAVAAPSKPAPASAATTGTEPTPRVLGGVGLAGLFMGAAGVGLTSVAILRLAQGRTRTVSPDDRELAIATDFRPQGRAFLGIGLAAVVLGATALAVDLTVLRVRRTRRVALAPFIAPSATGLVVQIRLPIRSPR